MKYLSLFTGIGGFELGILKAYENNNCRNDTQGDDGASLRPEGDSSNHASERDWREPPLCIGYSEIDKYAIQIYQSHFPDHKNYGDITKIDEKELPDFDLLVGGFPCQSFSIAGKRRGFSDTRGTLFFDIARILQSKKPRLLLLENVKGILSHDNGNTFRTIIAALDELGYDLQWQVLNSKNHGVPQNRERVLIVGHLRGTPRPEVFPFIGSDCEDNGKNFSNAIDANYHKGPDNHGQRTHIGTLRTHKDGEGFREMKSGIAPALNARARADGSQQGVIIQRSRGKNKGGEHELAPTLTGKSYQDNNHLFKDMRIRRLTPTECSRLQGFPDSWTKYGLETITPERYNKDYVNAKETNPLKILSELQEAVSENIRKGWRLTESFAFLQEEILQSGMYEAVIPWKMEREPSSTSRKISGTAIGYCDRMWQMWLDKETRYPSQRPEYIEQLFIQLRSCVSKMSCEGTSPKKVVLISDTQRYKTLGNAVTVNVIRDVCERLLK